jgi:hypothetical protein
MANVTYTVPNKNGSYDGDMVVKQYTSVDIDTGDTVTTDQPCRGLFILSRGNVNINGTLSMRSRGAFADPTASGGSDSNAVDSNGLRFPFLTSGGSSSLTAANTLLNGCGTTARSVIANFMTLSSNGTILSVVRQGANGGSGVSSSPGNMSNGNNGSNGSTGQSGGGGSGGSNYNGTSGAGAYGSCFSGGSGGGSVDNNGSVTSGANWGGAGGNSATNHGATGSGGAGNPKGNSFDTSTASVAALTGGEGNGTGGLIIIVAKGNVTIGASGKITAEGGRSDHVVGANDWVSTGGGAGGGNIIIAHKGTYTNNGTVTANGGQAGVNYSSNSVGGTVANGSYHAEGGNGGNGSVQTLQII